MLLTIIGIIFLLLISAFFSGSETGLTAASRAKIHRLKNEGDKRAKLVADLRDNKERLIGAILLGNNAVNIAASALATSVAISYFGDEGVWIVTLVLTLVVLIFAEVLPKTYAFSNAESVAIKVAPIFMVLIKIFSPVTMAVQRIVDFTLKIFGVTPGDDSKALMNSTEALRGAIEMHHDDGNMIKDARDMLGSILDLSEVNVSGVMLHRNDIETIDFNNPIEKIIDQVMQSQYTRLPVWRDRPDNVIGILHGKNLIRALHKAEGELSLVDLENILITPWFVPSTTTLLAQLDAFRAKHYHFALVVDEYGELQGMVTLEDIIEEIVGQIMDEHDQLPEEITENTDGSYLVSGATTVRDLNRVLDWDMPDDQATTIAGLLIDKAAIIPEEEQIFRFYNYRFQVIKREGNRIMLIKITEAREDE